VPTSRRSEEVAATADLTPHESQNRQDGTDQQQDDPTVQRIAIFARNPTISRTTERVRAVRARRGARAGGAAIVAVDGRSSRSKSTLAGPLEKVVPGAVTVHTDDIAWSLSRFGWADLLATGVLEPLHTGQAANYRPPAWNEHDRQGAIEVPAATALVMIEGVGASRRETADPTDLAV
jgi:hypothetical protein